MKQYLLIICLLYACVAASQNLKRDSFYLDPVHGEQNGNGRNPNHPAKSLPKIAYGKPGTTILYKRGIVVRGDFEVFSGTAADPVVVGAYGKGNMPVFMKSLDLKNETDWVEEKANIWRYKKILKATPCANMIYDNDSYCGAMRWQMEDLKKQGDWFMVDTLSGKFRYQDYLYIWSSGNPGKVYKDIEYVPDGNFRKFLEKDSFIVIQDIHVKNVGTHCFQFHGAHHITIRNCDISYIGGSVFWPRIGINGKWVRYGNGIEIWEKGRYLTIEHNRIYEIYDGGFVAQGSCGLDCIDSIVVRNNLFWNTGFDNFDNSWGKAISRVWFINNTCVAAGEGWPYETEGIPRLSEFLPDTVGWHVFLDSFGLANSDIHIRHNIFFNAKNNKLVKVNHLPVNHNWPGIDMDYNCYFQQNPRDGIIQVNNKTFHASEFKAWQQFSGKDSHSFVADPLFINAAAGDYRLKPGSPCSDIAGQNQFKQMGAVESH